MAELHIFMGSSSDEEVVKASKMFDTLNEVLGEESYVVSICSAHRNPAELDKCVKNDLEEGIRVFIGIAGMAAALPGALAGASGMRALVIGVPLDEYGIDSCLYMPPGVPVATAGVGKTGLKQAALLACQVLTIGDAAGETRLQRYLERTTKQPQFDIKKELT